MSEVNFPKPMTGYAQKRYGSGFCSSFFRCPPSARVTPKGLSKKVSCCGQNGSSASRILPLPLSWHRQFAKHPEAYCLHWVHVGSLSSLFPGRPDVIDVAVLAFRVAFDHLTCGIKWWMAWFYVFDSVAPRKNQSIAFKLISGTAPLLLEHNPQPWCSFRAVSCAFWCSLNHMCVLASQSSNDQIWFGNWGSLSKVGWTTAYVHCLLGGDLSDGKAEMKAEHWLVPDVLGGSFV